MLLDYKADFGEILYLALEDTYPRLKELLELIQGDNADTQRLNPCYFVFRHYRWTCGADKILAENHFKDLGLSKLPKMANLKQEYPKLLSENINFILVLLYYAID